MADPETPTLEVKDEADAFIVQQTRSPDPVATASEVEASANKFRRDEPQQWSTWYRRYISALVCIILIPTVNLTSDTLSFFAQDLAQEFSINSTLLNLTITNFSICFCLGPLLWCPLSEHYGRRPVYLLCLDGFTVCAAVSPNAASIVIFRSLAGLFGSACLPLAPAVLSEIWEVEIREREMGIYALYIIAPSSGVMFGSFLAQKGLGWRGTCWLLSMITGLCTVLVVLTLRESYRPQRAAVDEPEDGTPISLKNAADSEQHTYSSLGPATPAMAAPARFWHVIAQPYLLLFHEPILVISSMYLAIIGASASIFVRAWAMTLVGHVPVVQLLGGMATSIGGLAGVIIHNWIIYPRFYLPKAAAVAPERVQPEVRLTLAIWAAPLFAGCLFWCGWTLSPDINVVAPIIGSSLLGLSAMWVMQTMYNYIIDIYEGTVATVMAWCTVLMYTFITIFTVHSAEVFGTLGVRWILTLVGSGGGMHAYHELIPRGVDRYGPFLRAKSGRIR
ncbi:MFS general substrate transporter [Lentinus tigrinus ALCF2SS1-7]|uniref:MFS general substrate transporter n=1 Tax=Lentinus tigrinus ALCF2SS1-6 TaxID=1328759 RepID=A0A5C2SXF9_9APHY|nr:MFS general substrate transporter [Lentinus tigrinus ALCF2SS1-6]RPD78936.1 MFS general substrate transporter [Lentinus tigrinus ALCF2SS1-7]